MKMDPTEIGLAPLAKYRKVQKPQPTPQPTPADTKPADKVSPAAMDEVFAMLSRSLDSMQQSNAQLQQSRHGHSAPDTLAAPQGVGTIPSFDSTAKLPLDPTSVRDISIEMDRQRERLAQLLHDIELATS